MSWNKLSGESRVEEVPRRRSCGCAGYVHVLDVTMSVDYHYVSDVLMFNRPVVTRTRVASTDTCRSMKCVVAVPCRRCNVCWIRWAAAAK